MSSAPDVTVVVPNWNGRRHLEACLDSIAALDYPGHVETLVVDNGSSDGSLAYLRRRGGVRVLANERNEGFARACNRGAREAETPFVAFLNNDARADRRWLVRLVGEAEGGAAAVASRIVDWSGRRVVYGGAGMAFHGIGFQVGEGREPRPEPPRDVLFACGGAMLVDRDRFLESGGFDEDFFAYYEDVDLGWRLWVIGERVRYQPDAIAYHRHSATSRRLDVWRMRRLHMRNPILTIAKNYEEDTLLRALPAALLLAVRRTRYFLDLDERLFRLDEGVAPRRGPLAEMRARLAAKRRRVAVPPAAVADVLALCDVLDALPTLAEKRAWIAKRRRRSDAEIVPLFVDPRWPAERSAEWPRLLDRVIAFFGLEDLLGAGGAAHADDGSAAWRAGGRFG